MLVMLDHLWFLVIVALVVVVVVVVGALFVHQVSAVFQELREF